MFLLEHLHCLPLAALAMPVSQFSSCLRIALFWCASLALSVGSFAASEAIDMQPGPQWVPTSTKTTFSEGGVFTFEDGAAYAGASLLWKGGKLPVNKDWAVDLVVAFPALSCVPQHEQSATLTLHFTEAPLRDSSEFFGSGLIATWPRLATPAFGFSLNRSWSGGASPEVLPTLAATWSVFPVTPGPGAQTSWTTPLEGSTPRLLRVSYSASTGQAQFSCDGVVVQTLDLARELYGRPAAEVAALDDVYTLELGLGGSDKTLDDSAVQPFLVGRSAAVSSLLVDGAVAVPYIVAQPVSSWSIAGAIPALTVEARGNDLTYQWYQGARDDYSHPISGATSAVYQPNDYGRYWVCVTNALGSVNSAEATCNPEVPVHTAGLASGSQLPLLEDRQASLVASGTRIDLVSTATAGSSVGATSPLAGMSLDENWSVQADIELASGLPSSATSALRAGFQLYGATPNFSFVLLHSLGFEMRNGAPSIDVSEWYLRNDDKRVLAPDAWFQGPEGSKAALRIDYSAASGYLTYYVDKDGSEGPSGWAFHSTHQLVGSQLLGSSVRQSGVLLCLDAGSGASNAGDVCRLTNLVWRSGATVPASPVITTQPQNITAARQGTATFSVEATGQDNRYVWFKGLRGDVSRPVRPELDLGKATLNVDPVLDGADYWALAFNEGGVAFSEAAKLSLDPTKFAGVYLGSFNNDPVTYGAWALYVRPDNTGLFVGYAAQDKLMLRAEVVVNNDGTFNEFIDSMSCASSSSSVPLGAKVTDTVVNGGWERYTFGGSVKADGNGGLSVSLSCHYNNAAGASVGLSGSGELTPYLGTHLTYAGLYELIAVNGAKGLGYAVVTSRGHAYYVVATTRGVSSGLINLGSDGRFSQYLSDGSLLEGSVDASIGMMDAQVSNGTETIEFIGRNARRSSSSRLSNFSINTQISSSESVTAGFIVKGTSKKSLLMRGVGPALGELGVLGDNWQRDTSLVLNRISGGLVLGENKGWGSFSSNPSVFQANNAFTGLPFLDNSGDSALVGELADSAGGYTIEVKTSQAVARTAMAEIYEADTDASTRLKNLSALKRLTGNAVLTAGFVISGNTSKRVLIRAVGPSLANYGVPSGYLPNPRLKVFSLRAGTSSLIGENNDWWDTTDANTLADATTKSEAGLVLATGSADAAIAMTLKPGMYSIEMTSADGQEGIGLIEVYEAD